MAFYRGMTCENVTLKGDGGTPITAYVAKPDGKGPFPGVVLVHHLPGWSELYIETTRRFAHHGYLAICANLYERAGDGNPDDVAAKVRADGGIPDVQMLSDTEAAVEWMREQRKSQRQGRHFRLLLRRPARLHLCLPADRRGRRRRPLGRARGDGQGRAQREDAGRADRHDQGSLLPVARPLRQRRPRAEPRAGERARGRAEAARQDLRIPPLRRCGPRLHSIGTGRSTGPSRRWTAGARCSPSSASISRNKEAPCAHPSSKSSARREWRSAGTNGSRSAKRWWPMTTRAMRRSATSSRSISSTWTSNPAPAPGSS